MTEQEQFDWVMGLGPTREDRMRVIEDLLLHAGSDDMSLEDRVIARRWQLRLRQTWVVRDDATDQYLMNMPDQWSPDRRRARWFEEGEAMVVIDRLNRLGRADVYKERSHEPVSRHGA